MKSEEWYVILNMNCKYEICRMCPKSGLFKGSYEECEKWIKQKEKEEMKHTPEEIKNRLSNIEEAIGNIALDYITELEKDIELLKNGETLKELQAEVFRLTKACDETQKLLDKQIEVTYQLDKENVELKERNAELKGMYAHSAREAETYKQFFEIKEKENADLKAKNKWYSEQVCNKECKEVWGQVEELDKENTELKLKLDALEGQTPWKDIKDKSEVIGKLTKAKEHIRTLISCLINWVQEGDKDYCHIAEAEQFLNSEVEK